MRHRKKSTRIMVGLTLFGRDPRHPGRFYASSKWILPQAPRLTAFPFLLQDARSSSPDRIAINNQQPSISTHSSSTRHNINP